MQKDSLEAFLFGSSCWMCRNYLNHGMVHEYACCRNCAELASQPSQRQKKKSHFNTEEQHDAWYKQSCMNWVESNTESYLVLCCIILSYLCVFVHPKYFNMIAVIATLYNPETHRHQYFPDRRLNSMVRNVVYPLFQKFGCIFLGDFSKSYAPLMINVGKMIPWSIFGKP